MKQDPNKNMAETPLPQGAGAPAPAAGRTGKKGKKRKKRKNSRLGTALLFLLFFLGVGIIAYPTVSDWWNSFHQSRAIASYANTVEAADNAEMDAMLEAAYAYNRALAAGDAGYVLDEKQRADYESQLNLSGNGVIGFIQINAIGCNLPIYHGTDETVLQIAIGHLEWTSLPVGGPSTHSALSGHRGLPRARLFTDLDKLVEGDTFTITVLNQVTTYQVDQIRIVLPYEMQDLAIEPGMDYCTLVTCTPYGINTHRLLVRGRRIENAADEVVVTAGAIRIPNYVAIPAVAIPLLFVSLLAMLIYDSLRRRSVSEREMEKHVREVRGITPPEDEGDE